MTSCTRFLPGLVGVYVHGSAALGGMTRGSDLDILVVTTSGDGAAELGPSLLSDAGEPHGLELSAVTADAARRPGEPWPYVLHVNSADDRFEVDPTTGDPDLLAHYAVTRAAGITLIGPAPTEVIGPTDREQLLRYLCDELEWGLDHGDERYAVLNACRASVYATTGQFVSKIDGASWWISVHGRDAVVARAGEAQAAAVDLGASTPEARVFVATRIEELRRQCSAR